MKPDYSKQVQKVVSAIKLSKHMDDLEKMVLAKSKPKKGDKTPTRTTRSGSAKKKTILLKLTVNLHNR